MKALIFAAGLGTRLQPITNHIPKALVPIHGRTLLEHTILRLKKFGFQELIINVHHFSEQIIDFLKVNNNFGLTIHISDESAFLRDTGGGIKLAAQFLNPNDSLLVHNVDIFSNADLTALYHTHQQNNCVATLLVSSRDTYRYLLFDEYQQLQGWVNEKTGETKPKSMPHNATFQKMAFSGIQMLSAEAIQRIKQCSDRFPMMDFYLSLAGTGMIRGNTPEHFQMIDIGKIELIEKINQGEITLPQSFF